MAPTQIFIRLAPRFEPLAEQPTTCPACGSDDVGAWAANEQREDEADIVGCESCKWTAALTNEGAAEMSDHVDIVVGGATVRVTCIQRDGETAIHLGGVDCDLDGEEPGLYYVAQHAAR